MGALFSNSKEKWLPLLLLLVGQFGLVHAIAGSVEYLPGFEGTLPFQLETGYVGLDEGEDVQVFYYFVKSESNPKEDPLILWVTGGPGCSALTGLIIEIDEGEDVQVFYYFVKSESNPKEDPLILWVTGGPGCSALTGLIIEIGPVMFKMVEYNGSLPTILSNPNSWTKMASIIFVDLPLGTGFTYRKSALPSHSTDLDFSNHAYEFMRKWLSDHPEFLSNDFYTGGDSYSGMIIPMIAQLISKGNEAGLEKYINLKGYILGNPLTFPTEGNYKVQFSYGMGLIPDELYESLKMNCGGEYRDIYVDPNNILCLQNLKAYEECMDGINPDHILEPECGGDFLKHVNSFRQTRALDERIIELYNAKYSLSTFSCRNEGYSLAMYWANDKSVQDALHIQKGSIIKWKRCKKKTMTQTIFDVRSYHLYLSKKGYRSLIYSGDHDTTVPHQSTQAWIRELNYSIVDQWRSWRLVNRQIAGYTRSYSNNMTFATVKGAGHTAPEYRPEECFTMFKRWISNQPL